MGAMASKITSLAIVYSTIHSGTDQRKKQSSASLAFVRGIHQWPVNSPHKEQVTRKMFPFYDVIMMVIFFSKYPQQTFHYSLMRAKYGMPFEEEFSVSTKFYYHGCCALCSLHDIILDRVIMGPNRTMVCISLKPIWKLSALSLMMTSSNGNIFRITGLCAGNSPVTGEFPAQRPVTRSFDVFFDLNKWLSKQQRRWWFETPSRSLWHHCNGPQGIRWELEPL